MAIAALFVRVADRKGNVGFPDDQRAFVNQLLAAAKPTVVASFGSPYLIERFPNAKTWLAEFSTQRRLAARRRPRPVSDRPRSAGKFRSRCRAPCKRGDGMHLAANPMTLQPAPAAMTERLQARI